MKRKLYALLLIVCLFLTACDPPEPKPNLEDSAAQAAETLQDVDLERLRSDEPLFGGD